MTGKRWKVVLACTLVTGTGFMVPSGSMADQALARFPAGFVAQLSNRKEIYVATVRKNGTRSTAVPVWFAFVDGAIWFTTSPTSYKARRVKRGSPMLVSVQGKDGPFVTTKAEIVRDGAMADRLGGIFRPSRARNESGETILLRLTPAH
ncbi:MAG: pyridoxamine 5'-phosphate oxidase family protein [Candidatus Binatia bacterium]